MKPDMGSGEYSFKRDLFSALPSVRAFAISLCGRSDQADDLVQEAVVKAWASQERFEPGTNMRAWLFTILRNEFYNQRRRRKREVQDTDGAYAERLSSNPSQYGTMDFRDLCKALDTLPPDQREAIILVGASGFSYEEAAEICGCAVGTIKSRVNRARNRLQELMNVESESDLAPDSTMVSITSQNLCL